MGWSNLLEGLQETATSADLPQVLVQHPHVRMDPEVLEGSPYLVDTRLPVRRLWAFYCNGRDIEWLCERYPQVDTAKILDGLAFAYDNEAVIQADLERTSRARSREAAACTE